MAKKTTDDIKDELADSLVEALNKESKDKGKIAFFLTDEEDPSQITDWISTGNSMLDLAISNRPNGGIPSGRISEITGLEACVTEDTKIKVIIDVQQKEIDIKVVKTLLEQKTDVRVLSVGGGYTKITNYIEKGILKTYYVVLSSGENIKCSAKHLFYANSGWIKCSELTPGVTKIMTEKTKFELVDRVDYIGEFPIVDISVEHPEECYYGNGILNHNSGKSLMGAHLLAETQKKGGVAVFIDTETSVSPDFLASIGVDIKKMVYVNVNTIEEIFDNIESIIVKVRKASNNRLVTILVDSVAAASTTKEMASDHGVDGYATGKAIAISKAMRKITEMIARQRICLVFTNQLREKIGFVGYGDKFCVDPFTTKITIRYVENPTENILLPVEEEITMEDFSQRFVYNNDFSTPNAWDLSGEGIEVLTATGYKSILSFVVKPSVDSHYTDGKLLGTSEHRIMENGLEISLKNHPEFVLVNSPMKVVDIEVDGGTYLANGRNNHNTTSGGKALAFHASVRLRLKGEGKIKIGDDDVIGIKTKATVIKNRMGPPMRSASFNIFFDRGIDNYGNWLENLMEHDIIVNAKAEKVDGGKKKTKKEIEDEKEANKKAKSLQFILEVDGKEPEVIRFEKKDFPSLLNNRSEVREFLYNKLCDVCIMKYRSADSTLSDDIDIDTDGAGMED